jgi:hypothetical protein
VPSLRASRFPDYVAGRADGIIADGVDASDLLAAITGIALSVGRPDQRELAERLITVTVREMRRP